MKISFFLAVSSVRRDGKDHSMADSLREITTRSVPSFMEMTASSDVISLLTPRGNVLNIV